MSICCSLKLNTFGQVQNGTNEENQESTKGQRTLAVFGYAYELQEGPNHSINEHVDHVINMIKSLEVYIYIYIYIYYS